MTTSTESKSKGGSRFARMSRSPYVSGLPEWSLFPDDDVRQAAIEGIERSMMPKSVREVIEFLLFVGLLTIVPWWLFLTAANKLFPTWSHRGWIPFVGTLVVYLIGVVLAIRRSIRSDLRDALLTAGVPICMKCGYQLRGLPAETTTCPECGKSFDARAARLLDEATSAAR